MKRILLIVISVVTLIFSGCASVPQGVKSNMEKYNIQEKEQSDFKFSYIDISNLQSTSQEALLKNYGQFEISDNINLKQPSEINIMSFKPVSGFLSNSHKAMNLFFTEDQLSKQKIYNDGYYYEFSNENEKLYCSVCDDGFIAMLNPETFDISFSYSEPNLKVYHIDRKDNLKDEYQLNDQKCTVEEAVEYVDNWLDTKYKTFSNNLDYNVKTVIVREHNNKYLFEFSVEALYNEIPIDSYTAEMDESSEKMIFDNYRIEIQMINKNSIDSFTNRTNGLIPSVEESLNECISLESALEYCQHTFTDFKNIEISDIGIIYTLSPVYEYDSEQRPYIVKYNSHPVWEFIMDVSPEEILSEGQVNTNGYLRRYIYIDMVTGECNYNFNIISQGLGE